MGYATSCRICLNPGATVSIFKNEPDDISICSKINLCLGEKIEDIPGYPRCICRRCYLVVNDAFALKNQYRETCILLEKSLNIKQECIEIEPDTSGTDIEKNKENNTSKAKAITFNDAKQFEECVKPLLKFKRKTANSNGKPAKVKICKSNTGERKPSCSVIVEDNFVSTEENLISTDDQQSISPVEQKHVKLEAIVENFIKEEDKPYESHYDIFEQDYEWEMDEKVYEVPISNQKPNRNNVNNILCELCGQIFTKQEKLKQHKDRVHGQARVQCPICKKTLVDMANCRRHIKRLHSENKKFICDTCGKGFAYANAMRVHIRQVHLKIRGNKKKYSCRMCPRVFVADSSRVIHERAAHTGERPEVCTVCDSRFYHKVYLKEHMRLHTGETPYKCPVCERGYAQRGNMKSHIKHRHKLSQLDELTLKTIHPKFLKYMKP